MSFVHLFVVIAYGSFTGIHFVRLSSALPVTSRSGDGPEDYEVVKGSVLTVTREARCVAGP